jgi:hypothetical protein
MFLNKLIWNFGQLDIDTDKKKTIKTLCEANTVY